MKNEDIVCDCNAVTVEDVMNYIKKNPNVKLSKESVKKLRIGTRCQQCLVENCTRIDVHFSEVIGK